jgi:phage shock protein PspC (stress-responsive transcriptional regulator)
MLAGVAGGVAEMTDVDPSLVRIVWALLIILTGGIALLVYIIMAFIVPEAPDGFVAPARPAPGPSPDPGQVAPGGWIAPNGSVVAMAQPGPEDEATRHGRRRRRDRSGGLIAGLLLILIGGFFFIRQFVPSIDADLWWPVAAIAAGILLVIVAVLPSGRAVD